MLRLRFALFLDYHLAVFLLVEVNEAHFGVKYSITKNDERFDNSNIDNHFRITITLCLFLLLHDGIKECNRGLGWTLRKGLDVVECVIYTRVLASS